MSKTEIIKLYVHGGHTALHETETSTFLTSNVATANSSPIVIHNNKQHPATPSTPLDQPVALKTS